MDNTKSTRRLFTAATIIVIGTVNMIKIGFINWHAIVATTVNLVPAVIIMGLLGHLIGEIIDNPKNRQDADYKLAVLNALKKMDKSITMQELNEKLTKQAAEPDISGESEDDIDE